MQNKYPTEADNAIEKNNQLLLELEMDDEVKQIINFPEKYADTFLDVTVIKPGNNKEFTREKKVMSGNQVKQFIASMNLNQDLLPSTNEQKSAGDSCRTSNQSPPSCRKVYNYCSPIGDQLQKPPFKEASLSEIEKDQIHQVYTTPKIYKELHSYFDCKHRSKTDSNEKEDTPCVCRNCAIVGLVSDSQKKPFATEPIKYPEELLNRKHNANAEYSKRKQSREGDHQQCQHYFKHLTEKIRTLEERIAAQEQKAVPKDYFRRIVTKLVTHIGKVAGNGSQQIKIEASVPATTANKTKQYYVNTFNKSGDLPNPKFIVNPVSVHHGKLLNDKLPAEEDVLNSASLWKWGEDLLKPGIDLKNKIISVMEVTLNNLKKSKEKPKDEELKHFINDFSNNLYKTVNEGKISGKKQRYHHYDTTDLTERNLRVNNTSKKSGKVDEPFSVTYINSQILKWQETQTTFKFDSSDKDSVKSILEIKKTPDIHKLEFYKTIKNTKEEDKLRLWRSIWSQASRNGNCKTNKVTVQIPDKKNPKNRTVEVEYTLGELEYLLVGNKVGRR
ncbi:uncharacterized protein [Diabrotica undecimpunctata]|uniref:uncharacterized protein n=1 Tax=Diabrotica undecimpunctata TaxID=50387 RepID=UPI003B63B86E